MKILIYDKMQFATGVPASIKTPALSDLYEDATSFDVTFSSNEKINSIGIGYTDATEVQITNNAGTTRTVTITKTAPYHNGLYLIDPIYPGDEYGVSFTISHNGTYIGRVGVGEYKTLNTAPSKELGFYSTHESRTTLQGQVIPGAGGYTGRSIDLDVRYEIDNGIYSDIENAFTGQIGKDYPYFLLLDDEQHKVPTNMYRFYARTDKPISKLQSSVYRFLYSYKFQFIEAF